MANETGHCVNEKNFKGVVEFATAKGDAYDPSNTQISLANLTAKKTRVSDSLSDYMKKAAAWGRSVNERETVFEPVNQLMTKMRNAVYACEGITAAFKKDVHGVVNEILGVRATPKMKVMPEDPSVPTDDSVKQISAAQTGYDNKLGNIKKLKVMLEQEPLYIPNEDDVKVAALTTLVGVLGTKNDDVLTKLAPMVLARDVRDKEMYDAAEGSNELASKVKSYFKGAYGSNSPDFHHLAKFKFVNLKA